MQMLFLKHTRRLMGAVALSACCCFASQAFADTLTLGSVRDNTLYQDANGALSNGAGELMFAGNTNAGVTRRGLLRFDLSTLPAGATITNVTLTLHMSLTSAGTVNVGVHRALADWGEGTSDAPGNEGAGVAATTGDATWLHTFFNKSLWSTPGGDLAPAASAITSVAGVASYAWTSPSMISDVQAWVASPASNFGWLLRGDESTNNTSKRFDTRENVNASFRPTLMIEYTPVPAPAGVLLLALSGVMRGSRRRR